MNNIEEKVWSYIDGSGTEEERAHIKFMIENDEAFKKIYDEIISFDAELKAIELDEPPMAFTYRVMEGVRAEEAQKPLKATINNKIIYSIAAFFLLTIGALIIYALATVNWTDGKVGSSIMSSVKIPELKLSPAVEKAFLFFGVVMALYMVDALLRRAQQAKHN